MATETCCAPKHPTLRSDRMPETKGGPDNARTLPGPNAHGSLGRSDVNAMSKDTESPAGGVDEGLRVSSAALEAAARALASLEPDEDWPTNAELGGSLTGTRDDEYRFGMTDQAGEVLAAAVPHLTPEDVPHIVAQVLRDAADNMDLPGSDATGYYASEAVAGYREAEYHAEAWLRRRADRLDPTDRPAGDA